MRRDSMIQIRGSGAITGGQRPLAGNLNLVPAETAPPTPTGGYAMTERYRDL